jgi:molybdopterin molybdotransferase
MAGEQYIAFVPLQLTSRLKNIACAEAVVAVPEGIKSLPVGAVANAWLLSVQRGFFIHAATPFE